MSDLISREAVLEFEEYVGEPATWDKPYPKGDLYVKSEIIERIPSAEPKWIPVSERLPEKCEAVNITYVNRNPVFYYSHEKDVPHTETGVYWKGEWYWYSVVIVDILAEYGKWDGQELMDKDIEVIAWCELPAPYKGDSE